MSSSSPPQQAAGKSKKRVTKDEKIAQLKSELKLSKEENSRLKIQIQRLLREAEGGGDNGNNSQKKQDQPANNSSTKDREEEQKKFREAMRAFKKVTVQQEMCIKNLRTKASQKRKDIKERDSQIRSLEQRVRSLETTNKSIRDSVGGGDDKKKDLHVKIKDLQIAYDEMKQKKDRMKQILEERESKIESLQQQQQQQNQQKTSNHRPLSLPKRSNNNNNNNTNKDDRASDGESMGSVQSGSSALLSVSTESDFNVARLKTELAKKTQKILNLQMDLETVKDDLFQMKQQKRNSFATNSNSNNNNKNSGPFGAAFGHPASFGTINGRGGGGGDDWTDIDETDNESEFGDSFFPNNTENKESGDDDFNPSRDSFAAGFW